MPIFGEDRHMSRVEAERTLTELLAEWPCFHVGWIDDEMRAGLENWLIHPDVLRWLVDTVPPGATTLETGCGYTTVLLAILATRHTVISPIPEEHDSVRAYCADHDIPTDALDFVAAESQDVIHSLPPDLLDLVIIDGDHSFPAPFIDWY